jgi:hypothetical protein
MIAADHQRQAAKKPQFVEFADKMRGLFEPFRIVADLRQDHCPNRCEAKFDRPFLKHLRLADCPN